MSAQRESAHSAAELAHALVEATESLICVVDGDGRILLANAALERFTGRAAADLVDRCLWDVLVIPEEVDLARAAVADAMAGVRRIPKEVDWLAAGGARRRVALHNSVLADETGRPYATAFVGSDVTEQREREALSDLRASTDPLTGVGNRRVVFEVLQEHLGAARGGGCGLLFCDVDQFKQVNDQHGHAAGDQVLIELARRLGDLAGPDDVVARLGGDEFVLLSPGADQASLAALAGRLGEGMRAPVQTSAGALDLRVSVGSALGRPGEDADELMARADRAMYGSKTLRRRNRPRHPQGAVRMPR
ncbi:cyclic di-GMP phosphodiesterase Gmr [Blastococcus colisei]|uniref:Cyclic di-GMP phosphodiesterase Gmr n=1 Tax=Blastococcus colisei TaxID=1564162 RepID=A0A543PA43_9ACTN|nr:diguanylate cyclase [Blastococcus colisei]TQN40953.1 cyclic di-GMP phosphodiesterase Gmr [Blastococcus colisei]